MVSSLRSIDPVELWSRRHLVLVLFLREIKIRYKQSMFGWLWAVVRPVMLVIVFSFLFGSVAQLPSDGVPYPIYVFSGLLAWDLFANIVMGSASSIISHRVIVERIYCPRLLFPITSVFVALFDFTISLAVFAVLMLVFGYVPSANIVWLPVLALVVILAGLSVGLWLSAVAVWLRDVKFAINYLIQLLLLLTPVGYGAANIPDRFSFLVNLNPMACVIEAFRFAILGAPIPSLPLMLTSGFIIGAMLIGGLFFFNTMERSFADVI